ncbi:FAD-binding oxidoreductase [Oligoflexus tunisiensis]|uniref:FAD-binding oxidoreductase n=1 Tax=Oligoflexus tunisiensis TaxID=708132 RepID=UPI00114CEA9D|nr:FAD-binding oxidoreductase [Oligoflexus tunisiensis]
MQGRESRQEPIFWKQDISAALLRDHQFLCHGLGRSYGDSCLPSGGTALLLSPLRKLRSFDEKTGLLSAEAGLSLAELLDFIVPRGWFIPVSPGTRYVTLGGAIANDIHGKNHHKRGTFGCHVTEMEVLRSNGETIICSPWREPEFFAATIGGLGLTGVISWCTVQLIPIASAFLETETIRTTGLDDFFALEDESARDWEYSMSWIDCMAQGSKRGRGIFFRGNHAPYGHPAEEYAAQAQWKLAIPFQAPSWCLNRWSIRAFNEVVYQQQQKRLKQRRMPIDPFFYPLDKVLHWNRLYGKRGLLQYQFVLATDRLDELKRIFDIIAQSGLGSFLAVLKKFGDIRSPGMLSFPREGYTLTLDFQNQGERSQALFQKLDAIVLKAGGRLYPAKDAMMSPELFQSGYPLWREFSRHIDPKFTSQFWQRVSRG